MGRLMDILAALLLGLSLAGSVSAQDLKVLSEPDAQKAAAAINSANAGVKSLQADFMQVKEMAIVKEKMVSSGKMYFQDGSLRWEYLKPSKSVFVTDKDQMKSNRMFRSMAGLMAGSVTGINLNDPSFKVTMYSPGKGYVAELVPLKREMKQMFTKIRLLFGADNRVRQVELEESQGRTVITLSNVKYNVSLDPGLFKAAE
ncbi:MAG: outer membrane lipoprotein carrier protein LolA [Bacteroidales bacterium]|nr:outer membrane lipoprotein carrier protein LolA [Bacteroidales bacterium]